MRQTIIEHSTDRPNWIAPLSVLAGRPCVWVKDCWRSAGKDSDQTHRYIPHIANFMQGAFRDKHGGIGADPMKFLSQSNFDLTAEKGQALFAVVIVQRDHAARRHILFPQLHLRCAARARSDDASAGNAATRVYGIVVFMGVRKDCHRINLLLLEWITCLYVCVPHDFRSRSIRLPPRWNSYGTSSIVA